MQDFIDLEPLHAAPASLGLKAPGQLPAQDRARIIAMLTKAEASAGGSLRGYRRTMLNDSNISSARQTRALVAAALASPVGQAEIYVSGGAEYQRPDDRGASAIIAACGPPAKECPHD